MAGLGVALLAACKGKETEHGAAQQPSSLPSQGTAPEAPRRVSLQRFPARVGERSEVRRKSTMNVSVEFWQEGQKLGSNELSRSEEYVRTADVLGLLGGAPAKVRVRYDEYRSREVHPDKPAKDESHLRGHTYVVDGTEGTVLVTGDHGEAVTPAEKESLEKLHGDLGEEDPLVAALVTGPSLVGQSMPMKEPLFRALVSTGTGEFKSGTVSLAAIRTEVGRDVAVFDWSADMKTEEDNGLEILWHLKGEALLGVSPASTLHASVEGVLDVSGHTKRDGARVDLAGDGTFKDERTVTSLPSVAPSVAPSGASASPAARPSSTPSAPPWPR